MRLVRQKEDVCTSFSFFDFLSFLSLSLDLLFFSDFSLFDFDFLLSEEEEELFEEENELVLAGFLGGEEPTSSEAC